MLRYTCLLHIEPVCQRQSDRQREIQLCQRLFLPRTSFPGLFFAVRQRAGIRCAAEGGQGFFQFRLGNPRQGGEIGPLIRIGHEVLIHKQAVAVFLHLPLKRQGDQISKAAFRHGVLTGKQTVVGAEAQLMALRHSAGQQQAAQLACVCGGNRSFKEKPDMRAFTGAGALHGRRQSAASGGITKGVNIFLPTTVVKIGAQEPGRVVRQQRVDADHITAEFVPPDQVSADDLGRQRDEFPVGAVGTAVFFLVADSTRPLIPAGGRVPGFLCFKIVPALGVHILTPMKQLQKKCDFVLR